MIMDDMAFEISDIEFQDILQQLGDEGTWEMNTCGFDSDVNHSPKQESAGSQASSASSPYQGTSASHPTSIQDPNPQTVAGGDTLGENVSESTGAGPITNVPAVASDGFPDFEEMANQEIGISLDENFDLEVPSEPDHRPVPHQSFVYTSQPAAVNAALTNPCPSIVTRGQQQTSQMLTNSWAGQAPEYQAYPQAAINCDSTTASVRNLIPDHLPGNQGFAQQNVADGVNWASNSGTCFTAMNNFPVMPNSLSQPLNGMTQGHLLPPSLSIVPKSARNRFRHGMGAHKPLLLKSAISSVAPSMSYAPDEVYSARPVVVPTISSTDLARSNTKFVPSPVYIPLRSPPRPWDCFQYSYYGELDPAQLYTPEEIMKYLFNHPLHSGHSLKSSPLHILVQRNPARASHRYPTILSNRCRFHDCPHPTINQGHLRVAFNESMVTTMDQDPYIVAGYVHLWCLERFCNLPQIISQLNFSADKRKLQLEPRQRNAMRLALTQEKNKSITFEEHVLDNFIQACQNGTLGPNYPRYDQPNRPHEGTLTYQLSVEKLKQEPKSIARQRNKRIRQAGYEGSTLTTHLGNLELEAHHRKRTRLHVNQNQLAERPRRRRGYHNAAKYEEVLDDEEEGIDDSEEEVGCEEGRTARPSNVYIAPIANMLEEKGVQLNADGTKRPHEGDMESEPAFKRRMTASYQPSYSHHLTRSDCFSCSPMRAISDPWTENPAPTFSTSLKPHHQSSAHVSRTDAVVHPTVDHRPSIMAFMPADEVREQKIQRLRQQLQMLEAQETAKTRW